MISALVLVFLLALLIEKLVERVKDILGVKLPTWVTWLISVALGVAFCIVFQINIFPLLGFQSDLLLAIWLGQALTGVIVACGSNFTHDLLDNIQTPKSP